MPQPSASHLDNQNCDRVTKTIPSVAYNANFKTASPIRFMPYGLFAFLMGIGFMACGGSKSEGGARQGLFGTFNSWRPPTVVNCETTYRSIDDRERCRKNNQTRIVEPLRGSILITEMRMGKTVRTLLKDEGSYRVDLDPGTYEVCIYNHCSDPIEVRMRTYTAYSIQLPKDSVASLSK